MQRKLREARAHTQLADDVLLRPARKEQGSKTNFNNFQNAHQIEEEERRVEWKRTSGGKSLELNPQTFHIIICFSSSPSMLSCNWAPVEDGQFPTDCDVVGRVREEQRAIGTSGRIEKWWPSCRVNTIGRYDVNTARNRRVEHLECRKRRPRCCWLSLI